MPDFLNAETVGFATFVFVTLTVAGWRWLDGVEAETKRREAERRKAVERLGAPPQYTGPTFNRWGREQ